MQNKTAFSPSESLLELISKINESLQQSADSLTENGYGYDDYLGSENLDFSNLRDDALAERLTAWFKRDEQACKDFVRLYSSVEYSDMYRRYSEVDSISIGEVEEQIDFDEIEGLDAAELEYLCANVDAYTTDGNLFCVNYSCDRFILVLDESAAAEELGLITDDDAIALSDDALRTKELELLKVNPADGGLSRRLVLVKCEIDFEERVKARINKRRKKSVN